MTAKRAFRPTCTDRLESRDVPSFFGFGARPFTPAPVYGAVTMNRPAAFNPFSAARFNAYGLSQNPFATRSSFAAAGLGASMNAFARAATFGALSPAFTASALTQASRLPIVTTQPGVAPVDLNHQVVAPANGMQPAIFFQLNTLPGSQPGTLVGPNPGTTPVQLNHTVVPGGAVYFRF